jgi:NadR type nicotinamide-nucleotide adenylyltransferase
VAQVDAGYRMKRIAIFGPESTGKTRLAEKLAAHFGAPLVAEYAREFWDRHGVITLGDIPAIAREQWRREDQAARQAVSGLLVCDTEALTTMLWSDLLHGTCPDDIRRGAEQRCRNYALYLLLDIDVPFAPDPQRCFPDQADREKCLRVWRGALERRHLPFELVSGDWAAREQRAITLVSALLSGA